MKSIFYMMHVPWDWIKQRPHFLAEGLSKYFKVKVYFDRNENFNKKYKGKGNSQMGINSYPKISPPVFVKLSALINYYLKKTISIFQVWKNDIIWITFPNQYAHVRHFLSKKKTVVYDNMDDALAFFNYNRKLMQLEKELCVRADYIFCSAENLKEKLVTRHNIDPEKPIILNNAVKISNEEGDSKLPNSVNKLFSTNQKNLVYIGTISFWMDFDLIVSALENEARLKVILIGPVEAGIDIPNHPRLVYHEAIKHKYVMSSLKRGDALFMPFILNDIVLGVDPVKAYEYIFSGKPVVLKRYRETEKFEDFVYLYKDQKEFESLSRALIENDLPPKRNIKLSKEFAQENTWEHRIKQIVDSLIKSL